MVWKTTEDIEWVRGPRGSIVKCGQCNSQERPSIYDPYYAWFDFGGLISSTFPHMISCLVPVLEGGLSWILQNWTLKLSILDSYVFLNNFEEFPLHTYFKALEPRLPGKPVGP
jgi:hypothetical protein